MKLNSIVQPTILEKKVLKIIKYLLIILLTFNKFWKSYKTKTKHLIHKPITEKKIFFLTETIWFRAQNIIMTDKFLKELQKKKKKLIFELMNFFKIFSANKCEL